jgi:hypothetical protein
VSPKSNDQYPSREKRRQFKTRTQRAHGRTRHQDNGIDCPQRWGQRRRLETVSPSEPPEGTSTGQHLNLRLLASITAGGVSVTSSQSLWLFVMEKITLRKLMEHLISLLLF